jgi:hypothetical protein
MRHDSLEILMIPLAQRSRPEDHCAALHSTSRILADFGHRK